MYIKYVITLFAVVLISGCAKVPVVSIQQYQDSIEVHKAGGGVLHSVKEVDFWLDGTPNREYRVISLMTMNAPLNEKSMSGIAPKIQQAGADAAIRISSNESITGSIYAGNGISVPIKSFDTKMLLINYIKH
jgi:hypothetical protein